MSVRQLDKLKDICREWSQTALEVIGKHGGFHRTETDTWVRADANTFERVTWDRLTYDPAVAFTTINLAQFSRMIRAVKEEPMFAPLFGRYVGTPKGYGTVFDYRSLFSLFHPTDTNPKNPKAELAYDEAEFESKFNDLVRFAGDDSVSEVFLYPLVGFQSEGCIQLEQGLTIRHMSDEEIVKALQWGLLPTRLNQHKSHRSEPSSCFAVVRDVRVQRVVLAEQPDPRDRGQYSNERDMIEKLLGFAAPGNVRVCSTMSYSTSGWPYSIGAVFQPTSVTDELDGNPAGRVTLAEGKRFPGFWQALTAAWRGFSLATRRLYESGQRRSPVDRLLDDVIAAEAVLLPNIQSELGNRFSTNAAHYLGQDSLERRQLFEFYKKTYDARSQIAHGEDPAKLSIQLAGRAIGLAELESAFRESVKRLLLKMIENGDSTKPIEWTDLVIGPLK